MKIKNFIELSNTEIAQVNGGNNSNHTRSIHGFFDNIGQAIKNALGLSSNGGGGGAGGGGAGGF